MKKTELTFVRFDAQDVVTTSGWNPDADPFKVSMLGSVITEFNAASKGFDFLGMQGSMIVDSWYYGYNSKKQTEQPSGSWNAVFQTEDPDDVSNYTSLSDAQAIWDWLETHGYNGQ